MGINNESFGLSFSADDNASFAIDRVSNSLATANVQFLHATRVVPAASSAMQGFTKRILFAQKAMGLLMTGVGLKGLNEFLVEPVDEAKEFEFQLAQISQTSGIVGKDLKKLSTSFLALSSDLPLAASDLAKVGIEAGRLGINSVEDMNRIALSVAKFSTVTRVSVGEATQQLARMVDFFDGLTIEHDIDKIASAVAALAANTKTTADQILEITRRLGPMANSLGVTAADALGLAAAISDAGVTSELAGTNIRVLLSKIIGSIPAFAKELGIATQEFEDLLRNDIVGGITLFAQKLSEMDGIEATKTMKDLGITSARIIEVLNPLTNNMDRFRQIMALSNKEFERGKALQEQYDRLTDNLKSSLDKLYSGFQAVSITIGQMFLPVVKTTVDVISEVIKFFLELPPMVQKVLILVPIFVSLALAIGGVVVFLKAAIALLPMMLGGMAALGVTVTGVWATLWPILVAVGVAFAGIATAVALWESNFAGVQDVVLPIIERIGFAIEVIQSLLSEGLVTGDLAKALDAPENAGLLKVVQAISSAAAIAEQVLGGFFSGVMAGISDLSDELQPALSGLFEVTGELVSLFFELVNPILELMGLGQITTEGAVGIRSLSFFLGKLLVILSPVVFMLKGLAAGIRVSVMMIKWIIAPIRYLNDLLGGALSYLILLTSGPIGAMILGFSIARRAAVALSEGFWWLVESLSWLGGKIWEFVTSSQGYFLQLFSPAFVSKVVSAALNVADSILEALTGIENPLRKILVGYLNSVIDGLNMVSSALSSVGKFFLGDQAFKDLFGDVGPIPGFSVNAQGTISSPLSSGDPAPISSSGPGVSVPVASGLPSVFQPAPVQQSDFGPDFGVRDTNTTVNATMVVDGKVLGEVMSEQSLEQSSRNGSFRSAFGR